MNANDNDPNPEDWIGRTANLADTLDLRQAKLMQSVLPQDQPPETGGALPPLWNWLYFHDPVPLEGLGRDGHPQKGGFLPPVSLPRRMWAGGRFEFLGELKFGDKITKQSQILNVVSKSGKSGQLCFVTVEHRYLRGHHTVWREEHDIVYRGNPLPGQAKPSPVAAPDLHTDRKIVSPSTVMLFRYSALTFNGHRIHYDRDYAREVEGYPGLVFHGPLTATILADFANRQSTGRMTTFNYRAISPLFDTSPFEIFLQRDVGHTTAWACTPEGNLAMQAEAVFE